MKLSLIVRNLAAYDAQGKGYGRLYLYGDRLETTALRNFIEMNSVTNTDPDISFISFFNYLERTGKGHCFSPAEIRSPGTHASMTYIFNAWIAELTETQKVDIRDRVIHCHHNYQEGKAAHYGYGYRMFTSFLNYLESPGSSNSSGSCPTNGYRF